MTGVDDEMSRLPVLSGLGRAENPSLMRAVYIFSDKSLYDKVKLEVKVKVEFRRKPPKVVTMILILIRCCCSELNAGLFFYTRAHKALLGLLNNFSYH